jgi:hypothetical protein
MEWHDMMVDGYGRIGEILERVLNGLNQEDLDWQPKSDCNSIGWLCWHLTLDKGRLACQIRQAFR